MCFSFHIQYHRKPCWTLQGKISNIQIGWQSCRHSTMLCYVDDDGILLLKRKSFKCNQPFPTFDLIVVYEFRQSNIIILINRLSAFAKYEFAWKRKKNWPQLNGKSQSTSHFDFRKYQIYEMRILATLWRIISFSFSMRI